LLRELFYRLSSETIYNRFFNLRRVMPHAQLQRYCNVDHDQDVVLVATVTQNDVESIVGTASYHLDPTTGFAEIGLLIDDAWQARGVSELLRDRMIEIARRRRLKGLVAVALSSNLSLQKLIEQAEPRVETTPQGETIEMRLLLDPDGTD
jgi:RimJ/RimL family protein N-acetyltransferase